MFIIGFDNTGTMSHIIAAVLYIATANGNYINWLAVSNSNFDTKQFSKYATNKPFQNMGLASFLILMIQLQAVIKKTSLSIYLQVNIGMRAALWYENRGFTRMQNDISILPELLKKCYKTPTGPYIHFVTTKELIKDLKERGLNSYSEDVKQQYLNLLELSVPI